MAQNKPHPEQHPDETFAGNLNTQSSINEPKEIESFGIRCRLGEQAYGISGEPLGNLFKPLFIQTEDAPRYDLYMRDRFHPDGKRTTVGVTFGCFIPLHEGHTRMIEESRNENLRTIIAVCGYDTDQGKDFIPFKERIRLIKETYGDYKDVTIVQVDDHKIVLTGTFSEEAWKTWCEELFSQAGMDPMDKELKFQWYTGESHYLKKIEKIYPAHRYTLLEKSFLPISSTKIRENLEANRKHIHPKFQGYLEEKGILAKRPETEGQTQLLPWKENPGQKSRSGIRRYVLEIQDGLELTVTGNNIYDAMLWKNHSADKAYPEWEAIWEKRGIRAGSPEEAKHGALESCTHALKERLDDLDGMYQEIWFLYGLSKQGARKGG